MVKRLLVSLCGVLACACSSQSKLLTSKALGMATQVPQSRAVALKAQKYLAMAEKLKKFHDSGELDQGDVLDVLKMGGVIPGAPTPPGAPEKKGGPKGVSRVPPPVAVYDGSYRWPLDAGVVSSEFGGRWGKKHQGIDLAAELGEPVHASANGVVIYAGSGMRGYGNALVIRHDERFTTLYAHNKALVAKVGQKVTLGEIVARLGSTGHSTGPHVHFEIRDGEHALNPREKLVKGGF